MTLRTLGLTSGASLLAVELLTAAAPAVTAAPAKYSQAAAVRQFGQAGVTWTSSGRCGDRNHRNCTAFEQINRTTAAGVLAFKNRRDRAHGPAARDGAQKAAVTRRR
ncbi:hypothetical protein ACFVT2_33665 [Streptomyces sp. NPDC058000]|uniref:hypothetical protein n=1 Tax=Streptomyces sp. NPDC058000 TaxID=3346299 RepID=UPI0036ED494C